VPTLAGCWVAQVIQDDPIRRDPMRGPSSRTLRRYVSAMAARSCGGGTTMAVSSCTQAPRRRSCPRHPGVSLGGAREQRCDHWAPRRISVPKSTPNGRNLR
jgi:hypothetical protein